jgi:hypothetical protein
MLVIKRFQHFRRIVLAIYSLFAQSIQCGSLFFHIIIFFAKIRIFAIFATGIATFYPGMTQAEAYFKVWQHRKRLNKVVFSYADYFIVSLFLERGKLSYADKWIEIMPGTVVFANPILPSAWEPMLDDETGEKGFSCMFSNEFIRKEEWGFLLNTPLLDLTLQQAIFLNQEALSNVRLLFQKMMEVNQT